MAQSSCCVGRAADSWSGTDAWPGVVGGGQTVMRRNGRSDMWSCGKMVVRTRGRTHGRADAWSDAWSTGRMVDRTRGRAGRVVGGGRMVVADAWSWRTRGEGRTRGVWRTRGERRLGRRRTLAQGRTLVQAEARSGSADARPPWVGRAQARSGGPLRRTAQADRSGGPLRRTLVQAEARSGGPLRRTLAQGRTRARSAAALNDGFARISGGSVSSTNSDHLI